MNTSKKLTLSYIYGGVVQYRPRDRLAERDLTDYELVLIIEGHVDYHSQGKAYNLEPGDLVLARPGFRERYVWDVHKRTRHAYFHFDIQALPDDWMTETHWPVVHRDADTCIIELFRHIIERIGTHPEWPAVAPGPDVESLVESLMRMIFNPIRSEKTALRQLPMQVEDAFTLMRRTLDENPSKPLGLDQLADFSGCSKKHLCGLFKKTTGHSPMKSYRLLKLQLALNLLSRSNLSVNEIADRCGFDNPLYFTRCFTQTYGHPPTSIRKKLKAGDPPPSTPLPPGLTPRIFW